MQFTETFPLVVDATPAPLPPPFTVTSGPLPNATQGVAYSFQFTGTGAVPFASPNPPYNVTVKAGTTLPAGLSLSLSGLLSGTPTVSGPVSVGVTWTDSQG